MLDYSDEETESQPPRVPEGGPRVFQRRPNAPSPKTLSIFQEWKEKTWKLMIPARDQPIGNGFIPSEFFSGKGQQPMQKPQKLNVSFKGKRWFMVVEGTHQGFEDHPDSFYKSMGTLLLLSQFFAVLPVSGIRGTNHNCLSFKWLHYKTALWALTLLGAVFCFVCYSINGLKDDSFKAASGICYFACAVLSSLLMLNLSRHWKQLNREFAQVELKFNKYGYPKKIGLKFKIFTIVVLLVALVEHILAKLKNLETVIKCADSRNDLFSYAESFFKREYIEVFSLSAYSFWKGFLVFCAHFLITANWNFKDLYLCLISWTIAERFKQVHDLLDKVHGQDRPISFWREIRKDYNSLCVLTKRVDTFIRKLMFLSIGNNLFFICIQLFHSLKNKIHSFRLVYFFWSFGFLVFRTGFVAFSAARINDESKEPKSILYSVPQRNYTAEVRRFLTQLTTNEVALTGCGFFSITRSLILTITGSVITYEIVLVQFGSKEMEEELESNRTACF